MIWRGDIQRAAADVGSLPRVSIILPCYRAVRYASEALRSVFSQSYKDVEVLVINDGSPESEELERILLPYRARIRYLRQPNRGPGAARNLGISAALGAYVAFLDSDDIWRPNYLSTQIELLERDPEIAMVWARSVRLHQRAHSRLALALRNRRQVEPSFENLVRRLCHIHPSCVVARRSALSDAGPFDESLTFSEDLDLWARIAHAGGKIGANPKVLVERRVHPDRLTVDVKRLIQGQLRMSRKLLNTLPQLSEQQRSALAENIARCDARLELIHATHRLVQRNIEEAVSALSSANLTLRSSKLRLALFGLRFFPSTARRLWLTLLADHPVVLQAKAAASSREQPASREAVIQHPQNDYDFLPHAESTTILRAGE